MTKKPQTIFRNNGANQHYTVISNALLQDNRISHETKGLICELLSKPVDWEIVLQNIWKHGHSGRDKVLRMIKEATAAGYISSDRQRADDGTMGTRYFTVQDHIQPQPGIQCLDSHSLETGTDKVKKNKSSNARARELIEDREGIGGEGWSLSWPQIDGLSAMYHLSVDRGRQMARSLGLEWCRDGAPKSAAATLRRAMMAEEVHTLRVRGKAKPEHSGATPAQPLCGHGFQASSCSSCRTHARRHAQTGKLQ